MNKYLETVADNGQLVTAYELDGFTSMVYGLMGYNPEGLPFEVSVWREGEPKEADTLAESAPLHQEFYSTWEEAEKAYAEVKDLIGLGVFQYNPPTLPAGF